MRLHRFIGDFDLRQNMIEINDRELIKQITKVLRLKQGEQFILSDGRLNEAVAEITKIDKNQIKAKIIKKYKNENEPEKKVILYCAILKRENFELVVQKATEAGISEIAPIITERTVKTGLNLERLQKIIKEAAEQSGRGIIPVLHEPVRFAEAVKGGGILFDKSGALFFEKFCAGRRDEQSNSPAGEYAYFSENKAPRLFIGPEGGWSDNELNLAKEHKFEIASLGKLTLRAETAATIASYLMTYQ
ncbi:MAG TPA: RsmE family RNA methyltransferase [Candidatus Paceibacterota bacterium]